MSNHRCVCCIISTLAFWLMTAMSLFASQKARVDWKVDQHTGAMRVIETSTLMDHPDLLTLTFQNISDKTITAYAFSYQDGTTETTRYEDWFDSESGGLPNGEKSSITISVEEAMRAGKALDILAVVFSDGSSEGVPAFIESIEFNRLGQIVETARLKRIFREMPVNQVGDTEAKELKKKIRELPESVLKEMDGFPDMVSPEVSKDEILRGSPRALNAMLAGVRSVRENATAQVEQMMRLPAHSQDQSEITRGKMLEQLGQYYENRSRAHRAYLQKTRGGK